MIPFDENLPAGVDPEAAGRFVNSGRGRRFGSTAAQRAGLDPSYTPGYGRSASNNRPYGFSSNWAGMFKPQIQIPKVGEEMGADGQVLPPAAKPGTADTGGMASATKGAPSSPPPVAMPIRNEPQIETIRLGGGTTTDPRFEGGESSGFARDLSKNLRDYGASAPRTGEGDRSKNAKFSYPPPITRDETAPSWYAASGKDQPYSDWSATYDSMSGPVGAGAINSREAMYAQQEAQRPPAPEVIRRVTGLPAGQSASATFARGQNSPANLAKRTRPPVDPLA